MAEKRIDINLQIAGIPLPLKNISLAEEGILREAAKGINERWNSWRRSYPNNSDLEALSIVALTYAKAYLILKSNQSATEKMLQELDEDLDKVLSEAIDLSSSLEN